MKSLLILLVLLAAASAQWYGGGYPGYGYNRGWGGGYGGGYNRGYGGGYPGGYGGYGYNRWALFNALSAKHCHRIPLIMRQETLRSVQIWSTRQHDRALPFGLLTGAVIISGLTLHICWLLGKLSQKTWLSIKCISFQMKRSSNPKPMKTRQNRLVN